MAASHDIGANLRTDGHQNCRSDFHNADEEHGRVGREREQTSDDGSEVLVPVGEEVRELVETSNQRRNDEPEVEELICLVRRSGLGGDHLSHVTHPSAWRSALRAPDDERAETGAREVYPGPWGTMRKFKMNGGLSKRKAPPAHLEAGPRWMRGTTIALEIGTTNGHVDRSRGA